MGPARHQLRRLHPHHRAPPPQGGAGAAAGGLRQRPHLQGHLRGPLLRGLRGVLHRGRPGRRPAARSTTGRSSASARRTGSSSCRRSSSRCSTGTRRTPTSCSPRASATRRSASIRQGLRDISITRTSIRWGVPVPWDPEHVFYVWYDALINYATAIGYGSRPRALRALVARGAPPDRQGHPPLPLRVLAGDAAGRRHRPAAADQRPRLPAGRRREDEQDQPEPDLPGRPGRRLRRRRLPLPLPAGRRRSGPTATSATRAWSRATTATWPTTSATSCPGWPRWSARSATASVPRRARTARWPRWPPQAYAEAAAAWERVQPSVALEATWRLIRETNALPRGQRAVEGRARPGGRRRARRRARGAAHRDGAGLARPCPATAAEIWRRLGLAGSPADQRLPEAADLGRVPRRPAGREGRSALPPPPAEPVAADAVRWTDDHCHLGHFEDVGAALADAAAAGVVRVVDVGTDVADSTAAADRAAAHAEVWATAGVHPHEARHGLDGLEALLARAEVRGGGRVRARLPLRPLAPGRAAGRVRRPDRAGPPPRPGPGHPHP